MKSSRQLRKLISLFLLALTILSASPIMAQDESEEGRRACTPDVLRLCREFIPDAKQITTCLQQQKADLSADCRAAVFGARGKKQPD
jgi:hypothetical protein